MTSYKYIHGIYFLYGNEHSKVGEQSRGSITQTDGAESVSERRESCLVTETATGIAIEVVKKPASHSLSELLKGITKNNIHTEIDWGDSVGNEVW